jgi:dGTPase
MDCDRDCSLIVDLVGESQRRIAAVAPDSIADVRAAPALVAFSDAMRAEADVLKRLLHDQLYRHYQVMRMTAKARRIVADLFNTFAEEPRLLPTEHRHKAETDAPRAIADYVAGMTDRYAIREHRRLFAVGEI